MTTTMRPLGILALLSASLTALACEGEALPRYRFQPGQELALRNLQRNIPKHGIFSKRLGNVADVKQWLDAGLVFTNDCGFGSSGHLL